MSLKHNEKSGAGSESNHLDSATSSLKATELPTWLKDGTSYSDQEFRRLLKMLPGNQPKESVQQFPGQDDLLLAFADVQAPGGKKPVERTEKAAEKKLEKPAEFKPKNPELALLQGVLFRQCATTDQEILQENLVKQISAVMEKEFHNGKLPENLAKELKACAPQDFKQKLEQFAATRIQEMLKAELEIQAKQGKIDAPNRLATEAEINKGVIPPVLLNILLTREYTKSEFGPITSAVYDSVVSTEEENAACHFLNLGAAKLPIPANCPIKHRLNEFGRPEVSTSLRDGLFSGDYTPSFNIVTERIPNSFELKELLKDLKWNKQAGDLFANHIQKIQQKILIGEVLKLNRPEWLPGKKENLQQWMLKVGALVDLSKQMKGICEALGYASKMAGKNPVNFDRRELKENFPGKIEFDKDGYVSNVALNLPMDLTPSKANNLLIEQAQKWVAKNIEPAQKIMEGLQKASTEEGRVMRWQNVPGAGKFENKPYNLSCFRCSAETVGDKNGTKIRIRNWVDYYETAWLDPYDLTSSKVGHKDCQIDPKKRQDLIEQFKKGTLPQEQMAELQTTLPQGCTNENLNELIAANSPGFKAFNDKLDDLARVEYRDYDPNEILVMEQNGKLVVTLAKNAHKLIDEAENDHLLDTIGTIGLDLVFTATSVFGVGVVLKGLHTVGRIASVAGKAAMRTATKHEAKHSLVGGAIGVSGAFVHNAKWQTEAPWAGHARLLAITSSAVKGGGQMLGRCLFRSAPNIGMEARNLELATKELHNWQVTEKGASWYKRRGFQACRVLDPLSKGAVKVAEAYMIGDMSGAIFGEVKTMTDVTKAISRSGMERISQLLSQRPDSACKLLDGITETLANSDPNKVTRLEQISKSFRDIEQLPAGEKQAKINDLIKQFYQSKDKTEKALLISGVLFMSSRNGKLPDVVGSRSVVKYPTSGRGRPSTITESVKSEDLLNQLTTYVTELDPATKKPICDSPLKLACFQILATYGKATLPEYATACREVLADTKSSKDLKAQSLFGLSYCADAASIEPKTQEQMLTTMVQAYGCSQEQLVGTISQFAQQKDGDPEIRTLAASLLKAVNSGDSERINYELTQTQAAWRLVRKNSEVWTLNNELTHNNLQEPARKTLEARLERNKQELEAARKALTVLRNPKLIMGENGQIKELDPKDLMALPTSFARDFQDRLMASIITPLPDNPTDPENQEKRMSAAAEKLEAIELLETSGVALNDDQQTEIRKILVEELAHQENGIVAAKAIKLLLPSRMAELTPRQKKAVIDTIGTLLTWPHLPSSSEEADLSTDLKEALSFDSIPKYLEAAMAKEELLGVLPALCAGGLTGESDKKRLIEGVLSLISKAPDNNNSAAMYPSIRLAAIKALGDLGDKSKAVFDCLHACLPSDEEDRNGESNGDIRFAAYEVLEKLGDPELQKYEQLLGLSERDSLLAEKLAAKEFAALRPDRYEHAERIFQYSVDYWKTILERGRTKESDSVIVARMRRDYPHIEPKSYDEKHNAAPLEVKKKTQAKRDDRYYIEAGFLSIAGILDSHRGNHKAQLDCKLKAYAEVWDPIIKGRKDDWGKLLLAAYKSPDTDGQEARAALLYLATRGSEDKTTLIGWDPCSERLPMSPTELAPYDKEIRDRTERIFGFSGRGMNKGGLQLEAAIVIRQMLSNPNCHDKEQLCNGLMYAWGGSDTQSSHPHEARMEILGAIEDMLKANSISKMNAGRILHWALMHEQAAVHKDSPVDAQAADRMVKIIKLMKRTEYPLAMDQLKSFAGTSLEGTQSHCHPNVRAAALSFLKTLHDTAPVSPDDLSAQADALRDAIDKRQKNRAAKNDGGPDLADILDAHSLWKVMAQTCGTRAIKANDPRTDHLLTLLQDPNKQTALMAAWYLVNAANPENTHDQSQRSVVLSSPFFKKATDKLQELSSYKGGDANTNIIKQDAGRYLKLLQAWAVYSKADYIAPKLKQLTEEQKIFADAKSVLDGSKANVTMGEKKRAVESLIHIAAIAYNKGDLKCQKEAESVLRQVASGRDLQLAATAAETIHSISLQHKPLSDQIVGNGRRTIVSHAEQTTKITSGDGFKHISCGIPHMSATHYTRLNFDEEGRIVSYSDSDFEGEKKAGRDFVLGSINMRTDGSIVFDEPSGIRKIRRPSGDCWSYYCTEAERNKEAQERTAAREALFKNGIPSFINDKPIQDILKDMQEMMDVMGVIKPYDIRIKTLQEAMHHEHPAVRLEAARILVAVRNTGVENELKEEAIVICADLAVEAHNTNNSELGYAAAEVIKEGGIALGDVEFTNAAGTTIKLKNGNPVNIKYRDQQSLSIEWNNNNQPLSYTGFDKIKRPCHSGFVVNAAGAWSLSDGAGCYLFIRPDGSKYSREEQGYYFQYPDGSSMGALKDGWHIRDSLGATRIVAALGDEKIQLTDRKSDSRAEKINEATGGIVDRKSGTHFTLDEDGHQLGYTMYDSVIRYNSGFLPITISEGEDLTEFQYKPHTNILMRLKEADNTQWQRGTDGTWKFKKAGSDKWESYSGEIIVNQLGEYTFIRSDGTRIVHRLNGEIETHGKDGSIVAKRDGLVTRIQRSDGTSTRFVFDSKRSTMLAVQMRALRAGQPIPPSTQTQLTKIYHDGPKGKCAITRSIVQPQGQAPWHQTSDDASMKELLEGVIDISVNDQGVVTYDFPDKAIKIALSGERSETKKTAK